MSDVYIAKTQSFETIADFLRFGLSKAEEANLYYGHGTDNAWDDIYSLVLRTLHLPYQCPEYLLKTKLTAEEKGLLAARLYQRIVNRIPVPYLIHEAFFCGETYYVDERVLIPRSPIAELIEMHFEPWIDPERVVNILDLCTGSACIAIACCHAFGGAMVDAVDLSKEALEVAAINRTRHQVEGQLTLIESDCFSQVPKKQYDIIVSNPPYVGAQEMATLPREYQHEPQMALEAPNEGMSIVETILTQAADYLTEEGILVVEVGNTFQLLADTYPEVPFTWLEFERGGHGVFLLTRQDLIQHFSSAS